MPIKVSELLSKGQKPTGLRMGKYTISITATIKTLLKSGEGFTFQEISDVILDKCSKADKDKLLTINAKSGKTKLWNNINNALHRKDDVQARELNGKVYYFIVTKTKEKE